MLSLKKSSAVLALGMSLTLGLAACGSNNTETVGAGSSSSKAPSSAPSPVAALDSLTGKQTAVTLDPAFLKGLTSLKLTPATIGGATLDAATGKIAFPITGGNVTYFDPKSGVTPFVTGMINHDNSGLQLTGANDFNTRGEGIDECSDRLKQADVAPRVIVDNLHVGTTTLGLTPTHGASHPFGPRPGRRSDDPVGPKNGDRHIVRCIAGPHRRYHWPVRTPHHQRSNRSHRSPDNDSPATADAAAAANEMTPRRRRPAAPRPSASTSTDHADRWPWPLPNPP